MPHEPMGVVPDQLPHTLTRRKMLRRWCNRRVFHPGLNHVVNGPMVHRIPERLEFLLSGLRATVAAQTGANKDESTHHVVRGQDKIERDPPTCRKTEQGRLHQLQAGQNSMQILNGRERLLWHLRPSVSAPVIAHDQVVPAEHGELVIPFAAMEATAVQQHEWLPTPISLVVELSISDWDKTCCAHLIPICGQADQH